MPRGPAAGGSGTPFQVHTAPPGRGKNALIDIRIHGVSDLPDLLRPCFGAPVIKVYLGKDQVDARWRAGCLRFYPLPIAAVLGKLIAGYYGPLEKIDPAPGQEYIGNPGAQRGEPGMYFTHGLEYDGRRVFNQHAARRSPGPLRVRGHFSGTGKGHSGAFTNFILSDSVLGYF
uniref:Uncharacterized protein n=1 Tax=uncultured bacterium contig00013 TaxID=1181504 RepID=A0A806K0Q8_9BACT|nr:hypothetical protein [uncultured bacterium contig00013]